MYQDRVAHRHTGAAAMEIPIETLTPLWTGGVETGKVDCLHETGILGSMRWWMEALVRGMGRNVCDPTTQQCLYDTAKPDNGICDVCHVFGATGWRKRFRLEIDDHTKPDNAVQPQIRAQRQYNKHGHNQTPTWYFPQNANDNPRSGALTLRMLSLHPAFNPRIIGSLIQFLADWAAIGARPQMGFGVIELRNGRLDTRPLYDWLLAPAGSNSYPQLPSLRNFFLARIHLPGAQEQATFNLKYDLRRLFAADQQLRHFIMGTVKDGRMASKIKVSRPYGNGLLRVWGWIPEEASVYRNGWSRDTITKAIHDHLQTNCTLQVWREFNSPRDTVVPNSGDAAVFLRGLLGLEEADDAA
jgi:CRISPR-associated protein Cmr1